MTTRNVGFMIYDVLFGRDEEMNPKPQMLAGYVIEDDGRRWVMTLRDDLWFHDGTRCWRATALRRCAAGCSAIPAVPRSRHGSTHWRRRMIAPSWCG